MNNNYNLKHNVYGDIMFYYIIEVLTSLFIILTTFSIFNKKEITILEILILLFIFNISMFTIYLNLNIIYLLILSLIIIITYYLYKFLIDKDINKVLNDNNILINRGIINFNALITNKYTYDRLLYRLRKKGYNSPDKIDYCIKNGNDLIIFKKDSVTNYPISIIIDGKIIKDNLFSINRSIEWLDNKINNNNLLLKDINYAYYKNKDLYFITN